MTKQIMKYSMLLVLLVLFTSSIFAQGSGDAQRNMLQMELELTDQLIERAKEMVRNSESIKAKFALEQALKLQSAAWEKFRLGTLAGYREANMLTKQAREKAKYALVNGPFNEQNEDFILRKMERTRDMLNRIREEFSGINNPQLKAVYEQAQNNLRKAWELYRAGQYRPAVKLSNQVENHLKKIMEAVNRHRHGQEGFERQVENIKRTMEHAREVVQNCESEKSRQLMNQAENSFQLALEHHHQERVEAAVKALQKTRKMSIMAIRNCNWQENFQARYEKTKSEADRLRELIPSSNEAAHKLLNQVHEQLKLAKGFIDDDKPEAAGASLRAATLTLEQVIRFVNQGDL